MRETVDRVHDDQTFVSGPRRVRDHLPREEAEWVYFPDLSPDEVLLLKIYDSKTDGTARLTAHTAFDDPTSPPGAPAPRSIELRTLVFWDE